MQHEPNSQSEATHPKRSFFLEKTQRKSKRGNRVRIDLRKTEYPLLFNVATNSLNWRIWSIMKQSKDDRDVIWIDDYVSEKEVKKLNSYQRINHFPGSEQLGKKNLLAINLQKLKNSFCESFFPQTWIFPKDSQKFKRLVQKSSNQHYYIAKPEALSQGKGIFLFNSLSQLPQNWQTSNLVIQKYISNPYLIDGLKFDFRIYVLLRSLSPLRIYSYRQGLTRFATNQYQPPTQENQSNIMMHLTNYAINKRNPDFVFSNSTYDKNFGHKRSMSSVMQLFQSKGINTVSLENQIDSAIVKTILSCLSNLNQTYKRLRQTKQTTSVCFEILGFDIMLDNNLTPYVIEVNHSPSFATDSDLDYKIKKGLIEDTLKIIRVNSETKKQFLTGTKTNSIIDNQNKELQYQQDQYQLKNMGNYKRIFPNKSVELNYIYEQITGSKLTKLYRINYQSLNKTKISQIQNKKTLIKIKDQNPEQQTIRYKTDQSQRGSSKCFPVILDDHLIKSNHCFSIDQAYEFQTSNNKKFRINLGQKRIKKIGQLRESIKTFDFNQNVKQLSQTDFLRNRKYMKFHTRQKLNQSQEIQTLKLKNLQVDFDLPDKKQKNFKGSMIHSNKISKDINKSAYNSNSNSIYHSSYSSNPTKPNVYWTTRSMMMNYEKVKKQYSQNNQYNNQEGFNITTNLKYDDLVIKQTRVQTEVDCDEDDKESLKSPIKIKTLCYDLIPHVKKPLKLKQRSFIKPILNKSLIPDNRRFSYDQKKLIVGYHE